MNDDLFYSILAMDAYHRGRGSLPKIQGTKLGNASVLSLGSGFPNPFIEGEFTKGDTHYFCLRK